MKCFAGASLSFHMRDRRTRPHDAQGLSGRNKVRGSFIPLPMSATARWLLGQMWSNSLFAAVPDESILLAPGVPAHEVIVIPIDS